MDLTAVSCNGGDDEFVQYIFRLLSDADIAYFKLGEGGFDLSAVRTEIAGYGSGATTYSGTLERLPVGRNAVTITADPLGSAQVVTDDGAGNLSGAGGSGTINYKTGEWEVTFNVAVSAGDPIQADYQYHGTLSSEQSSDFGLGDGTKGPYYHDLENLPVAEGTLTVNEEGGLSLTDDGNGNLVGDGSGTVNYETGEVFALFSGVVALHSRITATYKYDGAPKAPDPTLTDLESEGDPNLYTFQRDFEEGEITFVETTRGRIRCTIYLDLWEGIDDGNGYTPYLFEGGLFSSNDEMAVYFTYAKIRKTGSTRIDFDVDTVL